MVDAYGARSGVDFSRIAAGGLFYAVGVVLSAFEVRLRHTRGVWHLIVLAGSVSHYFLILHYVL